MNKRRSTVPGRAILLGMSGYFAWTAQCLAGIGMTMPVSPPAERCSLNIASSNPFTVPGSPSTLLPVGGYELAPAEFSDPNSINFVNGSCQPSWQSCPANGTIDEQDGRVSPFLRFYAQTQDTNFMLASAVWTALGLTPPGPPSGTACGGTSSDCAVAIAQLAVTGRQAFNSFIAWNPAFSPNSSGPQLADLIGLVQTGYPNPANPALPAIPAIGTASPATTQQELQTAATLVLDGAYQALWAVRSNERAWRQFRAGSQSWIAVSGEDDTPHRPVNVPTAPFPQYDIAVPITLNGQSLSLTTRYMFAAAKTYLPIRFNASTIIQQSVVTPLQTAAPAIPTVLIRQKVCTPAGKPTHCFTRFSRRFSLPAMGTPQKINDQDQYSYIIYIHGGGSRLEEADGLAKQLIRQAGGSTSRIIVISFDLPNSAYADQLLRSPGASPTPLDPSNFEDNPAGNVYNFPILGFDMQFVTNFIWELGQQGVIDPKHVVAVMGGSLGGNLSLLLKMNGQPLSPLTSSGQTVPSPYNTFNSANSPITNPLPDQINVVAWSPTSMVSYVGNAGTLVNGNLTTNNNAAGWGGESDVNGQSTREQYFYNLYFTPTFALGGLPPDPEMWYRDDWADQNSVDDCAASYIAQSRFDRYEVYSSIMRRWTTAIDTEQAIFSFQTNTDQTNATYAPNYSFISGRILLAAGACDDYDNSGTNPNLPTLSTGTCNNQQIGNTGGNSLTHQDIYGYTHDVANDMQAAGGTTLFLNDTGHSFHDERPTFFASQILPFLGRWQSPGQDNNINISLFTGGDGLRWNSEVHALLSGTVPNSSAKPWVMDVPLNYWFHPWPSWSLSPNNPCDSAFAGGCTYLNTLQFEQNSVHNFTFALPPGTNPTTIFQFNLGFISGWDISQSTDSPDDWDVAGVAACLQPGSGTIVLGGATTVPVGTPSTLFKFAPNQIGPPPVSWTPPPVTEPQSNCNTGNTNPPPNGDVTNFM